MFATVGVLFAVYGDGPDDVVSVGAEQSARQVGEPQSARAIGEPAVVVDLGDAPEALAFAEPARPVSPSSSLTTVTTQASGSTQPVYSDDTDDAVDSDDSDARTASSTQPASPSSSDAGSTRRTPNTTAPTVTTRSTPTTAAPRITTTTAAPRATPTTRPRVTTTTPTTRPPSTTRPPATTTTPQPAPPVGATVGFQDLRNKSNVTLENVIISNPGGRCIDLTGARNITIRNVTIQNCGTSTPVNGGYDAGLIRIENASNITITNSTIEEISAERFGSSRNNAIQIRSSNNVSITNNTIRNVRSNIDDKGSDKGSRAIKVEGSSSQISITGNHFYNAGRNAVQFSRVRNAAGISISNNTIEGRGRWDSDYEDMINLYSSSGTPQSPIRISNNTLRNGGPSTSGTGMILGDGDAGTGPTEYVIAEGNRLIDPGHVGINLAGGNNLTIKNNTIVGTGNVPHKTTTGFVINHYGYSAECRNHTVTGNRVWMDNQHLPSGVNHTWIPNTCTSGVTVTGNVWGDSSLR